MIYNREREYPVCPGCQSKQHVWVSPKHNSSSSSTVLYSCRLCSLDFDKYTDGAVRVVVRNDPVIYSTADIPPLPTKFHELLDEFEWTDSGARIRTHDSDTVIATLRLLTDTLGFHPNVFGTCAREICRMWADQIQQKMNAEF